MTTLESTTARRSPDPEAGHPRRRSLRWARLATAAGVVVLALLPGVSSDYHLYQYELIFVYAAAALGMFIAVQVAGQFMIGHVAIMAAAAYGAAYANVDMGWSPMLTWIPALLVGGVAAMLLGGPGARLNSYYLGIVSIFGVLIITDLTVVFEGQTGGKLGKLNIERLGFSSAFSAEVTYWIVLAVLLGCAVVLHRVLGSTWGTRLQALRDAPQALQMAGVSAQTTKLWAYLLSSIPASLAGWLIAHLNGVLIGDFFGLTLTLVILAGVMVGGRRLVIGVVLGTFLFAGYSELVGTFSQYNELGLGVVLLLAVIVAPEGIDTVRWFSRRRRRTAVVDDLPVSERDVTTGPALAHAPLEHGSGDASEVREHTGDALVVTGLTKTFGGNRALDDVSFTLGRGRIIGLVGPNGSGKTTVVNAITGFVRPDGGSVELLGTDVVGGRPVALARQGISRTFQVPQLVDDLSVRRNIDVGLLHRSPDSLVGTSVLGPHRGSARAERELAAEEIVNLLRLDREVLDVSAGTLSLGLKRVVEIGRVLAGGADVICLDEPAAGLNDEEIARLDATLRDIARTGRTVLLVEHHMHFVLDVCDDVLLLEQGRVAEWAPDVDPAHLPDALRRHMGGLL